MFKGPMQLNYSCTGFHTFLCSGNITDITVCIMTLCTGTYALI